MVEIYSSRLLTFEKDRLTALSSLARTLKDQNLGNYIAGLWSYNLPQGLAWISADPDARRPRYYRAPSWSWSSIEGAISYTNERYLREKNFPIASPSLGDQLTIVCATVKDIAFNAEDSDPFGDLKSAHLVLSAPVGEAILIKENGRREPHWADGSPWVVKRGSLRLGFHPDTQSDFDHREAGVPWPCLTLLLGEGGEPSNRKFMALVLEKVVDQDNTYRRVGVIKGSKFGYPAYLERGFEDEGMTWEAWHDRLVSTLETWFSVQNSEVEII